MSEEQAVPKLSGLEKAGWRWPRPWEVLLVITLSAGGIVALSLFPVASVTWKICQLIGYVTGALGVLAGVAHKGPREQMILAESDIATAEALGKPAPAKALAIVAASTGTPVQPPAPPAPEEAKP